MVLAGMFRTQVFRALLYDLQNTIMKRIVLWLKPQKQMIRKIFMPRAKERQRSVLLVFQYAACYTEK
jgi:hypothetical protein